METTESQSVKTEPTPHEMLVEKMKMKYPDRDFSGANGQNPQDELESAILARLNDVEDNEGKLRELFIQDPRSAEFISEWMKTGDPRVAFIETFGDEFFNMENMEDAKEKFKEQLTGWRERKKAEDDAKAEFEANWNKSLQSLEDWGNGKGLNMDEKVKVILRLTDTAENAIRNIFTVEDFEMAHNAMNYDKDLAVAKQNGIVEGRNEKIAAARKSRADVGKLPPAVSGQGARAKEQKPTREDIWAGIK